MALLRWVVANARNASWTTSTPSVWCRNACRKRRIAQTSTGFRRGRGDTHQTRHVTGEAASAEHLRGFEVAGGLHHVEGDFRAAGRADPISNAEALEDRVTACTARPSFVSPPAPPPPSVLAQIGGLKDEAGPPKEQHAGGTQALVDQGHRMLPPRLGDSLPHKVLVLVGTGQLDQQNLIGNLRCGGRQPLFKLQHLLWSVRKGLREQGFKRGEWMRVNIGVLMHQGKHSLGRLFRE